MNFSQSQLRKKTTFPRKNVSLSRYIDKISVCNVFPVFLTNTDTLPGPIICVRIVRFQLILPWYDNTCWVRYDYPRLTTSFLYLSQKWHLMCSHYIILVAFKGSCQSVKDELFRQQTGTKIIFVKVPGTQYSIIGQITPPSKLPKGGEHYFHKNGRVLFQIQSNPP